MARKRTTEKSGKKRDVKSKLRKEAVARVEGDANLARYSEATRKRVAGLAAKLAEDMTKGSDRDPSLLKETTKIQAGGRAGVFSNEMLNGLIKQYDPKKSSYKQLEEMGDMGQVQLGLAAIKAPMIAALSRFPEVVSEDPEVRSFVRAAMAKPWRSLVRTSMNAINYGLQVHEKLFEIRDIKWSWPAVDGGRDVVRTGLVRNAWLPKRYKDINPNGLKIWLDEEDGSFAGFTEKDRHEIEYLTKSDKAFVFTSDKEFGNLFGKSRLARAYDPYVQYKYAEFFQGRYFERFGEPGIKVGFDPNPVVSESGVREQVPGDIAISAAENYKGHGIVALPRTFDDDGNELNTFELIQDDRRGEVWIRLLEFWLKQILRSLLVPDRMLTQDERLGSYGMAKSHRDTFLDNLQEEVESFIDHVNLYIVPQLIDLNLGKDRARAWLVAPSVSREHRNLLLDLFQTLVDKDENVRKTIDVLKVLQALSIPVREMESGIAETKTATSSAGVTASFSEDAELAKETGLNSLAKKLMGDIEKDLDKEVGPVKEKIFGYEDRMKKVALDFLKKAKVDDAGRLQKEGNEQALETALKKIDKIAAEMESYFAKKGGERTSKYLQTFGDKGIEDLGKLEKLYGASLPKGWKSTIKEEKLARSFGGGLRSFLENLGRIAERTKSGLREILTSGIDRGEVMDAIKRNGRFMRHAAERSLGDAVKAMRGITKTAAQRVVDVLPRLEKTAKDSAELWASGMLGAAAGAAIALKLDDEQTEEVEKAAEDAVGMVEEVKPLSEEDTLPARVEATQTHKGYVDLTVEGPARGAYRWALWSGAGLGGWDVWKFFKGPKTTEVKGHPAASSTRYDGTLGTTEWWDAEGRREGVEEPLQQYLFHYGDRDYAYPMPREWAEEKGIEFRKVGGE